MLNSKFTFKYETYTFVGKEIPPHVTSPSTMKSFSIKAIQTEKHVSIIII